MDTGSQNSSASVQGRCCDRCQKTISAERMQGTPDTKYCCRSCESLGRADEFKSLTTQYFDLKGGKTTTYGNESCESTLAKLNPHFQRIADKFFKKKLPVIWKKYGKDDNRHCELHTDIQDIISTAIIDFCKSDSRWKKRDKSGEFAAVNFFKVILKNTHRDLLKDDGDCGQTKVKPKHRPIVWRKKYWPSIAAWYRRDRGLSRLTGRKGLSVIECLACLKPGLYRLVWYGQFCRDCSEAALGRIYRDRKFRVPVNEKQRTDDDHGKRATEPRDEVDAVVDLQLQQRRDAEAEVIPLVNSLIDNEPLPDWMRRVFELQFPRSLFDESGKNPSRSLSRDAAYETARAEGYQVPPNSTADDQIAKVFKGVREWLPYKLTRQFDTIYLELNHSLHGTTGPDGKSRRPRSDKNRRIDSAEKHAPMASGKKRKTRKVAVS